MAQTIQKIPIMHRAIAQIHPQNVVGLNTGRIHKTLMFCMVLWLEDLVQLMISTMMTEMIMLQMKLPWITMQASNLFLLVCKWRNAIQEINKVYVMQWQHYSFYLDVSFLLYAGHYLLAQTYWCIAFIVSFYIFSNGEMESITNKNIPIFYTFAERNINILLSTGSSSWLLIYHFIEMYFLPDKWCIHILTYIILNFFDHKISIFT